MKAYMTHASNAEQHTLKQYNSIHTKSLLLATSIIIMIWTLPANAGRDITSFPFTENFNSNNYSDLIWIDNGATHTWESTGGWQSSGAAKFTPPLAEGRAALGQFTRIREHLGDITQLNVRFLVYYGSEYVEHTHRYNKLVIMNRIMPDNSPGVRPMLISRGYGTEEGSTSPATDLWRTLASCDGTVCNYEGGDYSPDGTDSLRIGDAPNFREEQWISVELEANTATGIIRTYVYTQDGQVGGLISTQQLGADARSSSPGGVWDYVDLIGGYFNGHRAGPVSGGTIVGHPESYFKIDELEINSSYIGPPAGFLSNPPPSPPILH